MSEFDLSGDTSADYGFDGSDSFSLGSENVSATGPSGGSGGSDNNFFGGDSVNVMDFGRGPVSNITNASNYDPNFAALQMIGRGLTPNSALRNQISFDVPSQMLPQIEGRLGPIGPKFYSEAERFLQEDLTDFVQSGPGVVGMIGNFLSDNFNDAKKALGKMGDAVGGLDIMGIFSSDVGQKAIDGMADNVAFDASGNRIDLTDTRQIADFPQGDTRPVASIPKVGIETILPQLRTDFRREIVNSKPMFSGTTYTGPGGSYTFSETMGQIKPRGGVGAVRSPDVYSEGNFDGIEDDIMEVADASQFLNPQAISRGLNYFAGPQIQDFFRGVTNNPNTTIRLGPGFDMEKQKVDDNIFSINIPFATG